MTAALALPSGIDDVSTRALMKVVNTRLDAIETEKVLVWMVDETDATALPHVADTMGLNRPEFQIAGAPVSEMLAQGVALRRKRGSIGALETVLTRLGYTPFEIVAGFENELFCDGEFDCDGVHLCGYDSQPGVYWVLIERDNLTTQEEARRIWDVVDYWRPKSRWPILVLQEPEGDRWFRSREEIPVVLPYESQTFPHRTSAVDTALVSDVDYHLTFSATGKTATLPAAPVLGDSFSVKTRTGVAATIDGNGKLIDGAATLEIVARQCVIVRYNGTTWEVC